MRYVIAVLLLAGCSTQPRQELLWYKPNSSAQEFEMDRGQCRAQAFSVASGNLMQIALVQDGCLRGKGWYLVPRQ